MQRLVVIACAATFVAFAGEGRAHALVGFANAAGTISALSASGLTVASDQLIPGSQNSGAEVSCSLDSASPSVASFSIGQVVAIDCEQGALREISSVDTTALGKGELLAGFPTTRDVPSHGPNVTTTQCAAAWNATASASERQAIVQLQPLAARVGHETTILFSPSARIQRGGPTCLVTFILAGARTVEAKGYWKHATVPIWHASTWSVFLSSNWVVLSVPRIIRHLQAMNHRIAMCRA